MNHAAVVFQRELEQVLPFSKQ